MTNTTNRDVALHTRIELTEHGNYSITTVHVQFECDRCEEIAREAVREAALRRETLCWIKNGHGATASPAN